MRLRNVALGVVMVCVLAAGCDRLHDALIMQEPLDALPEGACMVVTATDVVTLWQRAEQHKAAEVLGRLIPNAGWFQSDDYRQWRTALEEFESTNDVDLERDLLFNVLSGRMVIGMYPKASGEPDIVMAAELRDPARFRRFVDAVLAQPLGHDIDIEAAVVDDKQAFWVRRESQEVLFMHAGKRLVASTQLELARSTWDVIEGRATTSATRNPLFTRALDELGMHHVVVVEIGDEDDRIPWAAQGMSWRNDGLHFRRTVAAPPETERHEAVVTPRRRDDMLRSIPRGVTLAYYARPTDADLVRDLLRGLNNCGGSMNGSLWRQSRIHEPMSVQLTRAEAATAGPLLRLPRAHLRPVATSDTPLGMSSLPFNLEKDVLPWCGDELVFILSDLEKTGVIPIPAAALIIEVADEELAGRTLYDLESTLTNLPFDIGAKGFVDVRYGGQTYRSFSQPFLESISPSWWTNGDIAVISTTRLLMQQIIDTRRVGKRNLLNDSSFEDFNDFVPESASVLALTDLRRFYRSAHEMVELPRMLSDDIDSGVRYMEQMSVLFDHFPASAVYLDRQVQTLTLNAWLREDR